MSEEAEAAGGTKQEKEILHMMMRSEHPNPQFERAEWLNLQDPAEFATLYQLPTPEDMLEAYNKRHAHAAKHQGPYIPGQPVFISEYGGIKWDVNSNLSNAWGYGDAPKTEQEFLSRYKGLTDLLLDNPYLMGFCYTQLYDVEQEVNGLYTYDRKPKFDMSFFRSVNSRKAKIEE